VCSSDLDWTVGWLHEGDRRPVGRYGGVTEVWAVNRFYDDHLSLGIGAGPYLAHDRYGAGRSERDRLSAALSLTAAWRFSTRVGLRGVFHRIATDYDGDSDVFMGGLAFYF
jgi:hypothetical protein